MNMEAAIKELQDAMAVMAHLEKRQSELLKEHSERIVRIEELEERHRRNMLEIEDKLNGLIGYIDRRDNPGRQQ